MSDRVDPGHALGIATAMALVGRIVFGFVLDKVPVRVAAAVSFLNQVAAVALLASASEPSILYIACGLYGLSVGNNITIAPLIIQREYPAGQFAALVASSSSIMQFTFAFGPAVLGLLRDGSGSYIVPLWCCAGSLIVAAVWVLAFRLKDDPVSD